MFAGSEMVIQSPIVLDASTSPIILNYEIITFESGGSLTIKGKHPVQINAERIIFNAEDCPINIISDSGIDGQNGAYGGNPANDAMKGLKGHNGKAGTKGSDRINVSIQAIEFQGSPIIINTKGGDGGNGGEGGSGSVGPSLTKSVEYNGTLGPVQVGQDGGDGGDGGQGGMAGKGSVITLEYSQGNPPIVTTNFHHNKPGLPGKGGPAGPQGPGQFTGSDPIVWGQAKPGNPGKVGEKAPKQDNPMDIIRIVKK